MIRVLLADDQALVRAGFSALIDSEDDMQVVGQAGDGNEALQLARRYIPDVVAMDIRMPGLDGIAATTRICAEPALAATKVLVLTTFEINEYVFEAVRAGASGFLLKDTEPAELLRAIRAVAAGNGLLAPSVTRALIEEFATRTKNPPPNDAADVLTTREREVIVLVGSGLSNDDIAARLVVSPATAKTHVSRAMQKLQLRDRAQVVVFCYEVGLVRPGWSA